MYNAFWRLALFVRGQSFSVKTFDRSRKGCQVIREEAGNDFRGPSVQALPLPSRVSFSRTRFFLVPTASKRLLRRLSFVHHMWRSTFVREMIFTRSIRLKQTDRTCWMIQTHSEELNWAGSRNFHELNSPSLVRLTKSSTFGPGLTVHVNIFKASLRLPKQQFWSKDENVVSNCG